MKLSKPFLGLAAAVCMVSAFGAEVILIQPLSGKPSKIIAAPKKLEQVVLTGTLQTVPMGGAKTLLQSTNYGRVVLFSPLELEAADRNKLEAIEKSGLSVKVTATMATICAERELKAEVMGCRVLDVSRQIRIERQ